EHFHVRPERLAQLASPRQVLGPLQAAVQVADIIDEQIEIGLARRTAANEVTELFLALWTLWHGAPGVWCLGAWVFGAWVLGAWVLGAWCLWLGFGALLAPLQVGNVAIYSANQVVRFDFQCRNCCLVAVRFILANVQVINQLINRTPRDPAKPGVVLVMPAAMAFRNIVGNRERRAAHLRRQDIFLLRRQL